MRALGVTIVAFALLVASCAGPVDSLQPDTTTPLPGPRLVVFISDLHIGVGRDDATGAWHALEDFRWGDEFKLFLDEVHRMGGSATDLVLNGDTFELWQSLQLSKDCLVENDRDAGCSEAEAVARIQRVIAQHGDTLRAIGQFAARAPSNRVIIVPGNHDAALLFPKVAAAAAAAINAPAGRLVMARQGYWVSADGRLFAEHGHQIGEEVNRFASWPEPFKMVGAVKRLLRPWGEQMVLTYYNPWELKYPIIDNIDEEAMAVRYGFKAEGLAPAAVASAQFFRFFLFGVSWDQFARSLGPSQASPKWDIVAIRKRGDAFLVESFASDDPLRAAAQSALDQGTLPVKLAQLSDDEIVAICDGRAALQAHQAKLKAPITIVTCPREGAAMGAITQAVLRSRDKVFGQHLNARRMQLGRAFDVFVYSHTHRADPGFSPLKGGTWTPLVLNTGAWQRVISTEQLEAIKRARNLTNGEVLRTLRPEDLPPCYGAVIVKPYTTQRPDPRLQFWRSDASGAWFFADKCP